MEVTPHPPVRRWQEELDPAAQLGPYQPPVVLLDLLARLLGAESYAAADEPRRRRIRAAVEQMVAVSRTEENMIPAMLAAVRAEATLGEICDALRVEWGAYREPARF